MLSILTNFGCHFTCPYCIVKKTGIDIPKTTVHSLDGLEEVIRKTNATRVSVSGGGDPLFEYDKHVDFYDRLWSICTKNNVSLEMHTSYIYSKFPYELCSRVVYHVSNRDDLFKISRYGFEKVRVVFVVTEDFTPATVDDIFTTVQSLNTVDELSFRQMVGPDYKPRFYCHEYLKQYHSKRWYYIEQADYNIYYVDGKLVDTYETLRR